MFNNKLKNRAGALIVIALLAYGTTPMAKLHTAVYADNIESSQIEQMVTGYDFLSEGVKLYEKLSGESVELLQEEETKYPKDVSKALKLGLITPERVVGYDGYITRQNATDIIYKAIIKAKPLYEMSPDEVQKNLNYCYDNAYIYDVNTDAYAFMIKHRIINCNAMTNPDQMLTKSLSDNMLKKVYDFFSPDISISVGQKSVCVGDHVQTLIDTFGNPNRIDETEYDFKWYVYNSKYTEFIMVGVAYDRVCAFYSNARDFEYKGIKSGDNADVANDFLQTAGLSFNSSNNIIDSVMYFPYEQKTDTLNDKALSCVNSQLVDLLNANRAKNNKISFIDGTDDEYVPENIKNITTSEGITVKSEGSDVFGLYNNIINNQDSDILVEADSGASTTVSVQTSVNPEGNMASAVSTKNVMAPIIKNVSEEAVEKKEAFIVLKPQEITKPVITNVTNGQILNGNEDVVVNIDKQSSDRYYIKIFDIEQDKYIVNEFVSTDKTCFEFSKDLFVGGGDYRMCIEAVSDDGNEYKSDTIIFTYGEAEDPLTIVTPIPDTFTYEDEINVSYTSSVYHDFRIDVYDKNNKAVLSQVYENTKNVVLTDVPEGKYYMYVTALKRGTNQEVAQKCVAFEVKEPEPIITETILNADEPYNYIYGDENSPYVYFYTEEYFTQEVKSVDENGQEVVNEVLKKKITQKKILATKRYKRLAGIIDGTKNDANISTSLIAYDTGSNIANLALMYRGTPYVWGGETPSGFDCSGLVKYVCNKLGINISRTSAQQFANDGVFVPKSELVPGDLVYFQKDGVIHHVGIYIGNGNMVHAPRTGDVVKVTSIDTPYYQAEYAGAKRVF